ncbi:MAG TPA: AI-2E family transporter [Candidatus Aquilonibacter sp.]|nr:AI-2E family transporter [Candidatus Aquilonibacter sp.]
MNNRRNPWGWLTEERLTYGLKVLLVLVLLLYLASYAVAFLAHIFGLIYILVGAIFLAYLVYPAVHRLRARMPLGAAIAVVYLSLIAAIAFLLYLIVPGIITDAQAVSANAPQILDSYQRTVNNPNDPFFSHLPDVVRIEVLKAPTFLLNWLREHGNEAASHAFTILLGAFSLIATFVIIPLLSIYLLLDLDRMRIGILKVLPRDRWGAALTVIGEIDGVIGGFIRGQLIVAATVGILLTIALLILHVPYAFLLGALAAVGDLVPYVGAVLTFIPAVGIAAMNNGWGNAAIVAAIFVGIYQLEGHVISPMIVSSQVKLSPFIVLLAILIGAELGGIFGMLVAVPIAGALRVILLHLTNQEAA